jgi:outer membrane protein OmpU
MKNLLIATTALIATAGVAAADITMGGFGYLGAINDGTDTNVTSAVRLTFTGTIETDAGVKFTAFGRMTQANDNAGGTTARNVVFSDGVDSATCAEVLDEEDLSCTVPTSNAAGINFKTVSVAYSGLNVTVGNTHTAMNRFARGMSAWGYDNGGVWFRTMQGSGMGQLADSSAGARILASYTIGDIVVGVGSTVDGEATAATDGAAMDFGGRYSANGLTVGAAIDDESNWQAEVAYTMGQITGRVAGNSDDSFMVGASYAVDSALNIAVAYYSIDEGNDDLGLNVTYALGGGATLSATAGQVGDDNVVGLGVQFSF